MSMYGFYAVDIFGNDITWSVVFGEAWNHRHDSESARNYCRMLIRTEKLNRVKWWDKI